MDRDSIFYKIRRKGQILAQKILPDDFMACLYSRVILKKAVDLNNPQTFNEKIQWLKLYYFPNTPKVIRCSDKFAVRSYVQEKGLADRLVPLLGVWKKAEEIAWSGLPNRFVLKCNHGCAYNILCSDFTQFDKIAAIKQLKKWQSEDFGVYNIERHYSKIKPHLITCEEYLGDAITDYKFFCFNGQPEFIYVSYDLAHDRQAKIGFFNLDGSKIPLVRNDYIGLEKIELPKFFNEMLSDAKTLCSDFPFVRVDFFLGNDRYYFAELTFTPSAGMMPFNPDKFDEEWGKKLDISNLVKQHAIRSKND